MERKRSSIIAAVVGLALLTLLALVFGLRGGAIEDILPGVGGLGGVFGDPGAEVGADSIATTPPNAPSNLGAYLTAVYDVVITWNDNSVDEDGFVVTHLRVDQPEPPRRVAISGRDAVSDIDQYTTCGATYRYIVASFNEAGESPAQECWDIAISECPSIEELTLGETEEFDFLTRQRNPAEGGDFGVLTIDGGAVFATAGNPNDGISSAGQLGDTPLYEVNLLTSSGFSSGNTPVVPGSTYVAKARRAGDYVVFRVNSVAQASPVQVNLSWFYYDATGKIIAEPCDIADAGITPSPICPDGVCDLGENIENCPGDCGPGCVLGDGVLNLGETCDGAGDCAPEEICSPISCTCGREVNGCEVELPPEVLVVSRMPEDGDGEGDDETTIRELALPTGLDPLQLKEMMTGGGSPCITDEDCPLPGTACDPATCSCDQYACQDFLEAVPELRGELVAANPAIFLCLDDSDCSVLAALGDASCNSDTCTCEGEYTCQSILEAVPELRGELVSTSPPVFACLDDSDCQFLESTCDVATCSCNFTCQGVVKDLGLEGAYQDDFDAYACLEDANCPGSMTCADDTCLCSCPQGTDGCTSNDACEIGNICHNCSCVPTLGCPLGSDGCTSDQQCQGEPGGPPAFCNEETCDCETSACPADSPCFVNGVDCTPDGGGAGICRNCECVPESACPAGVECADDTECVTYDVYNCLYDHTDGLWHYCVGMRCTNAAGVTVLDDCISEYYTSPVWMPFCNNPFGNGDGDGDSDGGDGEPPSCPDPGGPAC